MKENGERNIKYIENKTRAGKGKWEIKMQNNVEETRGKQFQLDNCPNLLRINQNSFAIIIRFLGENLSQRMPVI